MKAKVLLPLILVAPILAGCDGAMNIEEPQFKSYANKVEYSAYVEKLDEKLTNYWMFKTDAPTSFKTDGNSAMRQTQLLAKGDEELDKIVMQQTAKTEGGLDNNNQVYYQKTETNQLMEGKSREGEAHGESTKTEENAMQVSPVANVNMFLNIDIKAKSYTPIAPATEDLKLFDYMSQTFGMMFGQILYVPNYETLTPEQKAKYAFYVDGDVFTYTLEDRSEQEIKDNEDKVLQKVISVNTNKIQVVLEENKCTLMYSMVSSMEIEAVTKALDYQGTFIKPGEKASQVVENFSTSHMEKGDYSHDKVDITNFVNLGGLL